MLHASLFFDLNFSTSISPFISCGKRRAWGNPSMAQSRLQGEERCVVFMLYVQSSCLYCLLSNRCHSRIALLLSHSYTQKDYLSMFV
jgi:hypothetical protein